MACFANLTVNSWVGICQYHISPNQNRAVLAWYNGKITRVVSMTSNSVNVKMDLRPNNTDNDVMWTLDASEFVKTAWKAPPEDIAGRFGESHLAWRRYSMSPIRASEDIRELDADEVINLIAAENPEQIKTYQNLDTATMKQLIALLVHGEIPTEFKTSKKRHVDDAFD